MAQPAPQGQPSGQPVPRPSRKSVVITLVSSFVITVILMVVADTQNAPFWQELIIGALLWIAVAAVWFAFVLSRTWGSLSWRYQFVALSVFIFGFSLAVMDVFFVARRLFGWVLTW